MRRATINSNLLLLLAALVLDRSRGGVSRRDLAVSVDGSKENRLVEKGAAANVAKRGGGDEGRDGG